MRKTAAGVLLVLALLLVLPTPGHARGGHSGRHFGGHHGFHGGFHHGFHGRVFIGGPWWWGPPWWGPPYPYPYGYYPPPYTVYPPVVEEGPQVYIEKQPASSEERPQGYWYYCASAKGYYPTVQQCSEEWIKVPPAPQ